MQWIQLRYIWARYRRRVAPEVFVGSVVQAKGWAWEDVAEGLALYLPPPADYALPAPPTPDLPGLGPELEQPGQSLAKNPLDALATTAKSTILGGPTGSGKSVAQAYVLCKIAERFPKATVRAIVQKNDSLNGLRETGNVTLFDSENPVASFIPLEKTWEEFERRRRATELERELLRESPAILVLADWHSIYEACKSAKWFNPYLSKLSAIVTVGREIGVRLLIDTQSLNLAALGLTADSSIRLNLNLVALGLVKRDQYGEQQGSYGLLENALANPYLFAADARERLKCELSAARAKSVAAGLPLALSSIEPASLTLLPNLLAYRNRKVFGGAIAPAAPVKPASTCPYCGSPRVHGHGQGRKKCQNCGKTWTLHEKVA